MKNIDVRNYAVKKGVKLWEIANHLGIADSNFSRKLRQELEQNEKDRIIKLIDKIYAERGLGCE